MPDWSGHPAYLQVADELRADIRDGKLPPGSQLPSYEALMEQYGVSITVVRNAVRELRTESLVRTHQGKGVFVSDPLPEAGSPASGQQSALTPQRLRDLESRVAALEAMFGRVQADVINLYHSTGRPYPEEGSGTEPGRQVG